MKRYELTELDAHRIRRLRDSCEACGGSVERCQAGTGEPFFAKLSGCEAFTDSGDIVRVVNARQPWEVKRAA